LIIYANIFINNTVGLRNLRYVFKNLGISYILDWLDILQRRIWFWWVKKLFKRFWFDYLCRWRWNWRIMSNHQINVFKILSMTFHFFKVLLNFPDHFIDSLNACIWINSILLFVIVWIKVHELHSRFILNLVNLTYFVQVILIIFHLKITQFLFILLLRLNQLLRWLFFQFTFSYNFSLNKKFLF
jgi:hypothetical protein